MLKNIDEVQKLVANKLNLIDRTSKSGHVRQTRWDHELQGIKQLLHCLGYQLEMNINPYYQNDGNHSTFSIKAV